MTTSSSAPVEVAPRPALTRPGYLVAADVLDNVGAHLGAERRRRGLSLRAAGAELGLAASTLHRLESGRAPISAKNAARVLRWIAG